MQEIKIDGDLYTVMARRTCAEMEDIGYMTIAARMKRENITAEWDLRKGGKAYRGKERNGTFLSVKKIF